MFLHNIIFILNYYSIIAKQFLLLFNLQKKENMKNFIIIKDYSLVIERLTDCRTIEAGKKAMLEIINDPNFSNDFSFILDTTSVNKLLSTNEVKEVCHWLASHIKSTSTMKMAVITKTPIQVANSTLIMLSDEKSNFHYEIFSTIEAAVDWLEKDTCIVNLIKHKLKLLSQTNEIPNN